MLKKYALPISLVAGVIVSLPFAFSGNPEEQPVAVDWSKRAVYAKNDIKAGQVLTVECLEERVLEAPLKIVSQIKSIGSAVDRTALRSVKGGEILMDSDFGKQKFLLGRPRPELEVY